MNSLYGTGFIGIIDIMMTDKQRAALALGRKKGLKRNRPIGLTYKITEENKGWIKKGTTAWNKGTKGVVKPNSGSFRIGERRGIQTEFKKGDVPWSKGKKFPEFSGENHPNWLGDEVGYSGIHSWIKKELGNPSECSDCGGTKNGKRFDWHNISGEYKRDIKDWVRLCSVCHAHEHKNWEARWLVA